MDYGIINDRSPHIIADLCEIISYLEDTPVSRSDVEEFITTKGGDGLLMTLAGEGGAETNEKIQQLTEDAFQHLMYRRAAFGDWYPFAVEHDVLELRAALDDNHKIYATLLFASRLKMFGRSDISRLAAEFETLCTEAAKGLFPAWNVYHFGAGGSDRARFGNKLKDAFSSLAALIRDDVNKRVEELSEQNVGDGGIDIVAVKEWNDPAESLPVYFAQCAAQQEKWPEKRFEAHPITHERYINFFNKPGAILFIPLCYRGPDGQWIDSEGHNCLLIDRLRIVELFQQRIEDGATTAADILALVSAPVAVGTFRPPVSAKAAA